MDGKRSSKLDSKCGVNEGVDVISQLQDDLIFHILSSLPMKSAAATCILSSRWLALWRHTPCLKFNDNWRSYNKVFKRESSWHVERRKFIELVNSVLKSHEGPHLKEFIISFPLSKSSHCTVTKWLEFVFSKRVQVLELDFIGGEYYADTFVLEDALREITFSNLWKSTNLRSLSVRGLKVSVEAIRLLLRNCPLLEQLIIKFTEHYALNWIEWKKGVHVESLSNVERFHHRHLKVFKFSLYKVGVDGNQMELLSFILESCVELQKIIVQVSEWTEQARDNANQLLQPKIPTHIQLIIVKLI